MRPVRRVVYLHGFASSPGSSKAQRFARELQALGVAFVCPDFNLPEFGTLTVTRMIGQVERELASGDGPVALIGSSLGGFVAIVQAQRDGFRAAGTPPDRLILLAPAVDFGGERLRRFGDHTVDDWRRAGRIIVRHHAFDRDEPIGFGLCEDAAQYDAFAQAPAVPTLVFHGRQDDTVEPASVEAWARGRKNVDLRLLDDGHQLTASMDLIWHESRKFLGFPRA